LVKEKLKTHILVCVGSGGVGKTTMAASLGILAAQQGLKVLVLTIDPSRRLAAALGIEANQGQVEKVPGQNYKGELYASVVNAQQVFDSFIERATFKTGAGQKILSNRLYRQLSTSLSGSQEFTSLEKLYSEYESGNFQLIILDTPPAKHAMEFLEAPQKLSQLFTDVVARWFRDPSSKGGSLVSRLLGSSTRQVLKIFETLTGSEFIRELSHFFENIEEWRGELQHRTIQMHRLLVDSQTKFCLVTSFDAPKLREAESILRDIKKGGYHVRAIFLNRAFPIWMEFEKNHEKSNSTQQDLIPMVHQKEISLLYTTMKNYFEHQLSIYSQFNEGLENNTQLFRVPQYEEDIGDLRGLERVAELIGGMAECAKLFQ